MHVCNSVVDELLYEPFIAVSHSAEIGQNLHSAVLISICWSALLLMFISFIAHCHNIMS